MAITIVHDAIYSSSDQTSWKGTLIVIDKKTKRPEAKASESF